MTALSSGDVFAGCTIEQYLGPGRFGEVYVARHPRIARRDLVEVVPVIAPTETVFRDRFFADVDHLSRTVRVHDRGEYDGRLWVALEYRDEPAQAPVPPAPRDAPNGAAVSALIVVVFCAVAAIVSAFLPWHRGLWDLEFNGFGLRSILPATWWSPGATVALFAGLAVVVGGIAAALTRVSRSDAVVGGVIGAFAGVMMIVDPLAWAIQGGIGHVGFGAWLALLSGVGVLVGGIAAVAIGVRRRPATVAGGGAPAYGAAVGAPAPAASHAPGRQGLALTAKYFPLAWMLAFTSPVVEVNGHRVPGRWGASEIPLPPGEHRVNVHVPYLGSWRIGAVDAVVPVHPGRTTALEYAAPAWAFSRGALGRRRRAIRGWGSRSGWSRCRWCWRCS